MTPRRIVVDRDAPPLRSYVFRDARGDYFDSLTFRDVMALVAVRDGMVRARWRRRWSPWFADTSLEPECDVFGIGYGSITKHWGRFPAGRDLIAKPRDEGPIRLTSRGRLLLDAVLEMDGTVAIGFEGRGSR